MPGRNRRGRDAMGVGLAFLNRLAGVIEKLNAPIECSAERNFFVFDQVTNMLGIFLQFRKSLAPAIDDDRDERMQEGFFEAKLLTTKAHTAAERKGGEANPFDVGADGVARYFAVVQSCTAAVKLRAAAK